MGGRCTGTSIIGQQRKIVIDDDYVDNAGADYAVTEGGKIYLHSRIFGIGKDFCGSFRHFQTAVRLAGILAHELYHYRNGKPLYVVGESFDDYIKRLERPAWAREREYNLAAIAEAQTRSQRHNNDVLNWIKAREQTGVGFGYYDEAWF